MLIPGTNQSGQPHPEHTDLFSGAGVWKLGRQEQQVCLLGAMRVPSSTSSWPGISAGSVR